MYGHLTVFLDDGVRSIVEVKSAAPSYSAVKPDSLYPQPLPGHHFCNSYIHNRLLPTQQNPK